MKELVTNCLNSGTFSKSISDFAIKTTKIMTVVELKSLFPTPCHHTWRHRREFSWPERTYRNCLWNDYCYGAFCNWFPKIQNQYCREDWWNRASDFGKCYWTWHSTNNNSKIWNNNSSCYKTKIIDLRGIRIDRNGNGDGVFIYVPEGIPSRE